MSFLFSLINEHTNVRTSPFWMVLSKVTNSNLPFPSKLTPDTICKITEGIEIACNIHEEERRKIVISFLKKLIKEKRCFDVSFRDNEKFKNATKNLLNTYKTTENEFIKNTLFPNKTISYHNLSRNRIFAPKTSTAFFPPMKTKSVRTSTVLFDQSILYSKDEINESKNEKIKLAEELFKSNESTESSDDIEPFTIVGQSVGNWYDSDSEKEYSEDICKDNENDTNQEFFFSGEETSYSLNDDNTEEEDVCIIKGAPFFDVPAAVCAAGIATISENVNKDLEDYCNKINEFVIKAKERIGIDPYVKNFNKLQDYFNRNNIIFAEKSITEANELDKISDKLEGCIERINSINEEFLNAKGCLIRSFCSDYNNLLNKVRFG